MSEETAAQNPSPATIDPLKQEENKHRKLATIQRILSLSPIPDADMIEKAQVLGWECVVKKGSFKLGDECVYFEIDSIIPRAPWNDFLASKDNPEKPIRIKTVKLKKQISQGICFKLEDVLDGFAIMHTECGDDLTDYLNVTKYEPPAFGGNSAEQCAGNFPHYIPKTDEVRIQSVPEILTKYYGVKTYVTEKIDGQSYTAFVNKDGEFGVCSRNFRLKDVSTSSLWQITKSMQIEEKLRSLGRPVALQAEHAGPGIQGNKLGLKERTLFAYNLFDTATFKYLSFYEFNTICLQLGIPMAPLVHNGLSIFNPVEEWVKLATMKSTINSAVWAEGVVVRPLTEVIDQSLGRLSFKVINPEFLLQHKE